MHIITRRNYGRYRHTSMFDGQTVPVRLKNGEFQPVKFLGFANIIDARDSKATPVKIIASAIESGFTVIRELEKNEFILGALISISIGVYAVCEDGLPKIVSEDDRPIPPPMAA